jgi:hypothetical protein
MVRRWHADPFAPGAHGTMCRRSWAVPHPPPPSTGTGVVTFLMGKRRMTLRLSNLSPDGCRACTPTWAVERAIQITTRSSEPGKACPGVSASARTGGVLGIPAAQQLWHVSKTHLLELSKEGFWRGAVLQPATSAALRPRHALTERVNAARIFEGEAAIVPRPERPCRLEPEEQIAKLTRVAEMTVLERHVAEPEHDVAVAELEHQPALAQVTEVSRLELWGMPELGCKTVLADMPEAL